jgi:hypothetical protein
MYFRALVRKPKVMKNQEQLSFQRYFLYSI